MSLKSPHSQHGKDAEDYSRNNRAIHPSWVRQVTITPAISTPRKIDSNARLKLIPRTTAATEPVQAPVIGRGVATNNTSPTIQIMEDM